MKRIWFAGILLLFLLAGCIGVSAYVQHCANSTYALVEKAENAARSDDHSEAASICKEAADYWGRHKRIFTVFLRHDMTDSVEVALVQLIAYAETRDKDEFLAICQAVKKEIHHVKDMEIPKVQNIF